MNTTNLPNPTPETRPEEQPVPQVQPRRRTYITPVFTGRVRRITTKTVATMALLAAVITTQAQTRPIPAPAPAPGVPSEPMNPDAPRDARTVMIPQSDQATRTNDGWNMFDERNTSGLGLQDDQLQRLRDVDGRYENEYKGLGETPSKNAGYGALSARRNTDVKGILTPKQYEQWMKMSNAPQDRMDHDTDGGMKKSTTNPGTAKPKTTTPDTKPATTPKN